MLCFIKLTMIEGYHIVNFEDLTTSNMQKFKNCDDMGEQFNKNLAHCYTTS